jgi:hypothetical protein
MNTDVSGEGVRISFYLQALFLCTLNSLTSDSPELIHKLAVLTARSENKEEISNALYTLIMTNVALAVTTLILGLKPEPGMSLQE